MKSVLILGLALVLYIGGSSGQRYSPPTFKQPKQSPILTRRFRESGNEPLWLFQGDNGPKAPSTAEHPFLPSIIDDVKFNPDRRYARSLGTHGHYHGGSHTISRGSQSTGTTHPGYNRHVTRYRRDVLDSQEPHDRVESSAALDSQETLLRDTRSVEQLASQEQLGRVARSANLDSQETLLRDTRSVEQLASQEQLDRVARSASLDSQETFLGGTRNFEQFDSQETLQSIYGNLNG